VDKNVYDKTIEVLKCAIEKARSGDREKVEAIKRLKRFAGQSAENTEHSVSILTSE